MAGSNQPVCLCLVVPALLFHGRCKVQAVVSVSLMCKARCKERICQVPISAPREKLEMSSMNHTYQLIVFRMGKYGSQAKAGRYQQKIKKIKDAGSSSGA